MNSKVKTFILILALAALIAAASFAYIYLSGRNPPENQLAAPSIPSPGQTQTGAPSVTSPGQAQSPASPASSPEPDQTADTPEAQKDAEDDRLRAPDFTVLDTEGNEVKLSELFGKPIVINFWASWCPPCKSEMPEFDKVYAELGEDVTFMMVDLVDGRRETIESGAAYIAEQGYSFPVYFDAMGEASYGYGIQAIPTTLFIDKDGFVVTGAQGAIDEQTLRRGIEYIIGG